MTRRGSHHGAGSFLPNQTPDRFKQANYFNNILLAKIGLTIDLFIDQEVDRAIALYSMA